MAIDVASLAIAAGVGVVIGWLAHLIIGEASGLLGYLVFGIVGAVAGSLGLAPMQERLSIGDPVVAKIIFAAIGAVIILTAARVLRRS